MNKISFKGRDFLKLKDFSKEEIKYLLALASYLKTKKKVGIKGNLLEGKNIALIFEKTQQELDVLLKLQLNLKEV